MAYAYWRDGRAGSVASIQKARPSCLTWMLLEGIDWPRPVKTWRPEGRRKPRRVVPGSG